jgi:hypothetical protein
MNHPTHTISSGNCKQLFGTESGIVRPEKLLDVLAFNNTGIQGDGGALYLQVHEVDPGLVAGRTAYSGGPGAYLLTGLTAGHTYDYQFGNNDTNIVNGATTITVPAGTFVASGSSVTLHGTPSALITTLITDLTVPQATPAPIDGAVPMFSFPVFSQVGGTLGRSVDISGVYCCWSSTQATKTLVANNSGSIAIVLKG